MTQSSLALGSQVFTCLLNRVKRAWKPLVWSPDLSLVGPGIRTGTRGLTVVCRASLAVIRLVKNFNKNGTGGSGIRNAMKFEPAPTTLPIGINCVTSFFRHDVSHAVFSEDEICWRVTAGESFTARYLISTVGCRSASNTPKISGLEDLRGLIYHTAN